MPPRQLDATLTEIIARGTLPQRYRTSVGQFIRGPGGQQIRLQNEDSRLTEAGKAYWKLLGVPPPKLYHYDQPLLNDTHVRAYDGSSVRVRQRRFDGSWRVTAKGEGYFRYNRTEYLVEVPYIILKNGNLLHPSPADAATWYLPLQDWFSPETDPPQSLPVRAAAVREARERGRRLQATPAQQLAEVREAAIAMLRDPTRAPSEMTHYTRVDVEGQMYTSLGTSSEVDYLWDETRVLVISERRTNFWDDKPPTTEVILGRPLRNWALPDGLWRPFDLHPDTFKEFDHGCCVQMLHKSFTKRASGGARRQGNNEPVSVMTVAQVEQELQACFEELGYKSDEFPFTSGWRHDGVPASMVLQFCRRQAAKGNPVKCFVFHKGRKIAEYRPENATDQSPCVTFHIFGEHAYFYHGKAHNAASKMETEAVSYANMHIREPFARRELPAFTEWREDWEFDAHDGFAALAEECQSKKRRLNDNSKAYAMFWTKDLQSVLASTRAAQERLQGTEACFAIRLKYGNNTNVVNEVQVLQHNCPKIRLKAVCEHAETLNLIATRIGMVYRGESYSAFGENLRLALCKSRRDASKAIKDEVLGRHNHCCAECGEELQAVEFDHITAAADGGSNEASNLQPLCPPCHGEKSRAQRLTTFANAWYSELSAEVMDGLVEPPKPQQLVFGDGTKFCLELDVVKCRRWAIEKAEYPLPVACILDTIEPYDGSPGDFVFVDAGPPDTDDYSKFCVYQGPRWFTWELAQLGKDLAIFGEEHFIAVFRASTHIEPSDIRAVYMHMEGAMSDALDGRTVTGFSLEGSRPEDARSYEEAKQSLYKKILLAMQGGWLTQHHYTWSAVDSPCMDDSTGPVTKCRDLENGTFRWFSRSETLVNRSMYLWGLYSLNREHMLVAQAVAMTKTIPRAVVHGILVDAVLVKASPKVKQQLQAAIACATRADGTPLYRLKDKDCDGKPRTKDAPIGPPTPRPLPPPVSSAWSTGGDDGSCRFRPSAMGAWLQRPQFTDRAWRVMAEEPGLGRGEDDAFQEEAAQAIFDNRGGIVEARGGTGKSDKEFGVLGRVKAKFEAAGYTVDVLAFTHVQSANVDGNTILRHLHAKSGCKGHVIIVDESSMVPLRLWAALAAFKFTGAKFVVLGDVGGQIPPIADRHREALWATIVDSRFMHELVGGLRVELRKFRRGGDQEHFDLVGNIYPCHGTTLDGALRRVREAYPVRRPLEQCQTLLCVTNKCRIALNQRLNAFHARKDAILVKCAATQDVRLWPGLVLQAAITDRTHLINALRYRVVEVTEETTLLVRVNDTDEVVGEPFSMPTENVPLKLRLTYAITYDSSQARTLYGNVRLVQTDHSHMTLRRLIVGLGRAPEGRQLEVE